jgi:hypothetical protein
MKTLIRIILILIVFVILIFSGGYFYLRYMPDKNMTKLAPDFMLTASQFASEYEMDPTASDVKFIDRIVEVTGRISDISTDQNDATVFILRDNEMETGILCTLIREADSDAAAIKPGDKVTVRGVCTGMLFEVVMNKCVIVR